MKSSLIQKLIVISFLLSGCASIEFVPKPIPEPTAESRITNTLLDLIKKQETFEINAKDFSSTSLEQIITLGTPTGLRIKLRFDQLGVALVEALKLSRDQELLSRLFELVQYGERPKVRAEALVALGGFSDPKDFQFLKSGLADNELEVRFAAIEALQAWGRPEGLELLKESLRFRWSPVLQTFAAQAVLSQGDKSGLPILFEGLESQSWLIRALSAHYLGDYADPEDYQILLSALNSERRNDFVVAELAIATLKLLSRRKKDVVYASSRKEWKENKEVGYTIGKDQVIELAPLVLVPPRLYIPESERIAQTLNNRILFLIENRLDEEMSSVDKNDPNFETLLKMLTPKGLALQTRYTELSLPIIEALGGTKDQFLRTKLASFFENDRNALVRASALLALAYDGNKVDVDLVQKGLRDPDPIVRFGAMEATLVGRYSEVSSDVLSIVYDDPVPAFRVFAMRVLMAFGDPTGLTLLRNNLTDTDWPARALSYWFLGRFGEEADYEWIVRNIAFEDNPFVQSEIALAGLRLAPLE